MRGITLYFKRAVAAGLAVTVIALSIASSAYAQAGTWTTKAPMPTARGRLAVGVVNGILYAVGGSLGSFAGGGGNDTAAVEAYNPTTDTWLQKAPYPLRQEDASAGVIDGILYVVGGYSRANSTALNSVEAYDPASDRWTAKASMPTPRYALAVGVVDGILYAIGGFANDGSVLSTVEAYDPRTNTWTTKAPMPGQRGSLAAGVVDGVIYVAGGDNGVIFPAVGYAYNPKTDTWSTKAPKPTVSLLAASGVIGGIFYVVGHVNSFFLSPAEMVAYDPKTDSWTIEPPMPTGRHGAGAGVVYGVLYVFGGLARSGSASDPLRANEAFTPNRPPIANAGPEQTVECAGRSGAVVTLNGDRKSVV